MRSSLFRRGVVSLCAGWAGAVASQEDPSLLQPPPKVLEARPFLRHQRPVYRNYALQFYTNPALTVSTFSGAAAMTPGTSAPSM